MEKNLVSEYYTRHYDESQIARFDFRRVKVKFKGITYIDMTKEVLESEEHFIQTMPAEEVKRHEYGELLI